MLFLGPTVDLFLKAGALFEDLLCLFLVVPERGFRYAFIELCDLTFKRREVKDNL
jgi:hypothetical protein